ncbi:MAG: zf-HC2 domain-containing protein [Armatimonadota bacterium]
MNCRRVQNLISAYADCELTGVEMLAIRHHLSGCAECMHDFDQMLQVKRALGTLPCKQALPDLAERICSSLDKVAVPARLQLFYLIRRRIVLPGKRTFASVAVALTAIFLMFGTGGDVELYNSGMAGLPVMDSMRLSGGGHMHSLQVSPASLVTAFASTPLPKPAEVNLGFVDRVEASSVSADGGNMYLAGFVSP